MQSAPENALSNLAAENYTQEYPVVPWWERLETFNHRYAQYGLKAETLGTEYLLRVDGDPFKEFHTMKELDGWVEFWFNGLSKE